MGGKAAWFWTTLVALLALDQATKAWVYTHLLERVDEVVVIPGHLSVVHAQNPGAALGILVGFAWRHYVFAAFTVAAVLVVADVYRRVPPSERFLPATLGLILAGTLGNAIDRVHKGTVTDFIRVYADDGPLRRVLEATFGANEYPTFNVADAALLVGVALFVGRSIREEWALARSSAPPGGPA